MFIFPDATISCEMIPSTLLLVCLLAASLSGHAADSADSADSASNFTMNGYTAAQFGDFTKSWKLVTVRFRKDTNEMRWTYANESAWKTLEANKTDYPDGAIFAKVGVMTKDDISFPSSAVPSGARRVQFMVRHKKKHASTDGWGYALFDSEGKVFPEDHATTIVACAACHRLVPERGFVFSQIASTTPAAMSQAPSWKSHLKFVKKPSSSLPSKAQALLKGKFESVQMISGELSKSLFSGTLDEIRPLLAQEAKNTRSPTALLENKGERFSIVIPLKEQGACQAGQMHLKGVHTVAGGGLYEISFCQ